MRFSTAKAFTVVYYVGVSSELQSRDQFCRVTSGQACNPSQDSPCCKDVNTFMACNGIEDNQLVWASTPCEGLGCNVFGDTSCCTNVDGTGCIE